MTPTGRVEVVRLAEPLSKAPVPKTFVPSINVTVSPSGGAPALAVTSAVKVTACPDEDGFGEEESVVLVTTLISILATKASMLAARLGTERIASPFW
jgi:hypothetical protein